jgi:hypothetical protein
LFGYYRIIVFDWLFWLVALRSLEVYTTAVKFDRRHACFTLNSLNPFPFLLSPTHVIITVTPNSLIPYVKHIMLFSSVSAMKLKVKYYGHEREVTTWHSNSVVTWNKITKHKHTYGNKQTFNF